MQIDPDVKLDSGSAVVHAWDGTSDPPAWGVRSEGGYERIIHPMSTDTVSMIVVATCLCSAMWRGAVRRASRCIVAQRVAVTRLSNCEKSTRCIGWLKWRCLIGCLGLAEVVEPEIHNDWRCMLDEKVAQLW